MTNEGIGTNGTDAQRTLEIALGLNSAMFMVGLIAGVHAQSTGLIADAFDMLADASGYGLSLLALHRGPVFKNNAARWNGAMLIVLGLGVILEVVRRYLHGSSPAGAWIIAFSLLSLVVNIVVLRRLYPYRTAEMYLRAAWIDTRADVVVNVGVLISGIAVAATGWRYIDLAMGLAISLFVIREGAEIVSEVRIRESA